jgi:hypothetical protein
MVCVAGLKEGARREAVGGEASKRNAPKGGSADRSERPRAGRQDPKGTATGEGEGRNPGPDPQGKGGPIRPQRRPLGAVLEGV